MENREVKKYMICTGDTVEIMSSKVEMLLNGDEKWKLYGKPFFANNKFCQPLIILNETKIEPRQIL